MSDRCYSYYPCPECGKEMEEYNQVGAILHVARCYNCGWDDGLDYYETSLNVIELLTKDEAIKRGVYKYDDF